MARPTKQGIDYYSLDVNFLKDIKVRKIRRACGPQSIEILLCLLGNIYRENGYYVGWDEDTVFLVADEVGAKEGLVEEVVAKAIQSRFFDEDKFNDYKILTSNGIQKRFFEATSKRKGVKIKKEFLVSDDVNGTLTVVNGGNNYTTSDVSDVDNEQSKVNKTKVNKSKTVAESSNTKHSEQTAVSYWLNQVNPGEAPTTIESINYWVKDFNGQHEIVIAAIDEMLENNVRSYKYIDRVLKSWESKGLDTFKKVQNYLNGHYSSNRSNSSNKARSAKLLFDYWWAEKMGGESSIESLAKKRNLTEREIEILSNEIKTRGYENAIS
ncbi:Lin1244/Lin1753 domain-containing protein [Enterococcus sp. AZ163]|uniref:Lin1244/Lin1753 domain-containing protein n=1 Tax=Enterococcus sp. AZ163 TaxID=2774638 RepID=UPI003D297C79